MKGKILHFMLTAALVCSLLTVAGCGSGTAGTSGSGNGTKSVSLPEKIDGTVIKVLGYDGWEREHEEIRQTLKDLYGATVEYTVVSADELQNKLALELVAGNTYDVIPVSYSLMVRDLCEPITKYVDTDEEIFRQTKDYMTKTQMYGGELYGISALPYVEVLIYNKTMLENLGYELPLDMYNSGTWNFDNFKKLIVGLSKEKNSDGDAITAISSWDYKPFLTANGAKLITKTGEKEFSLNFNDSKVRESLNFFQEISYINKAFVGWQGWSQADFQLGKSAMVMDRFGNKTHYTSDLMFEWDFVPWPQGPSGEGLQPTTQSSYGVAKGSKNPTGGAAYAYLFAKQDIEKREDYLKGYLSDEQIKRYESLYSKVDTGMNWATDCGIANFDELFWKISAGTDISSVLEEEKPLWQSQINTFLSSAKK